jgi:hypothetical protein
MLGYGQCTLIPLHSRPHEVEGCALEVGFSLAPSPAYVLLLVIAEIITEVLDRAWTRKPCTRLLKAEGQRD